MKEPFNLREWANRDDGKWFRIGNGPIGTWTVIGMLTFVASLVLFKAQPVLGIGKGWPIACLIVGLLLSYVGAKRDGDV